MKIVYFNDRSIPAHVRVDVRTGGAYSLAPFTYGVYEIDLPPNSIPYIKVWENNMVLIDWIDPSTLNQGA